MTLLVDPVQQFASYNLPLRNRLFYQQLHDRASVLLRLLCGIPVVLHARVILLGETEDDTQEERGKGGVKGTCTIQVSRGP